MGQQTDHASRVSSTEQKIDHANWVTRIGYQEKQNRNWEDQSQNRRKQSRVQVTQNQDRVTDVGYGKSRNQFRVKKTMKNRLLRRVSPGTLGHP
jgi:uncharacterized membrane protein